MIDPNPFNARTSICEGWWSAQVRFHETPGLSRFQLGVQVNHRATEWEFTCSRDSEKMTVNYWLETLSNWRGNRTRVSGSWLLIFVLWISAWCAWCAWCAWIVVVFCLGLLMEERGWRCRVCVHWSQSSDSILKVGNIGILLSGFCIYCFPLFSISLSRNSFKLCINFHLNIFNNTMFCSLIWPLLYTVNFVWNYW